MIKIHQVVWKFYSLGKLTCKKKFFVIPTKECICNTQFHGLVRPTVYSSTLSLKNRKLRQQLFTGKKAVPLMKVLLILKIVRGKVTNFEKLVGEKWLIFQKWLNFSFTKIFPNKVSLKRGFSGCRHGFGGCNGLGRFDWYPRIFIYSRTKGFISSSKLSSALYLAEGWTTNK